MTHKNIFGMFIHWGIYAQTGLQETALARYDMKNEDYEKLQHTFNPTEYNPEEWVLLAKKAGMKYICFTTKHHDGFCMWDTKYTDYNIMNTPYGKDVLKMLSEACAKHGVKLSLYYSNPDWHHEYGYNPASATHQWKAKNKDIVDTVKYREYVKNQLTELLTNYGPIYSFFWDIPPRIEDPSLNELVRSLQPNIFINDRGWDKGDFSTPEREYSQSDGSRFSRMTEACNSVGEQSWGYRKDEDFFTKRYLCSSIDKIMAAGGSYLLNVGPNEKGIITDEYADKIRKVGNWYTRMNGCLECHESDPFNYGVKNYKPIITTKNGKTYFHFCDGLKSSAFALSYIPNYPKTVKLMNNGNTLNFERKRLPEFSSQGVAGEFFQINRIPADDFPDEPIIIEIEW